MPGLPFLVSLALSIATLGDTLGWQDSGLFLACLHEGALLHPPGFVLWEALCRVWSTAFFFLPFTVEGQHDYWLVTAWIPLYLFVAAGLDFLGRRRLGRRRPLGPRGAVDARPRPGLARRDGTPPPALRRHAGTATASRRGAQNRAVSAPIS